MKILFDLKDFKAITSYFSKADGEIAFVTNSNILTLKNKVEGAMYEAKIDIKGNFDQVICLTNQQIKAVSDLGRSGFVGLEITDKGLVINYSADGETYQKINTIPVKKDTVGNWGFDEGEETVLINGIEPLRLSVVLKNTIRTMNKTHINDAMRALELVVDKDTLRVTSFDGYVISAGILDGEGDITFKCIIDNTLLANTHQVLTRESDKLTISLLKGKSVLKIYSENRAIYLKYLDMQYPDLTPITKIIDEEPVYKFDIQRANINTSLTFVKNDVDTNSGVVQIAVHNGDLVIQSKNKKQPYIIKELEDQDMESGVLIETSFRTFSVLTAVNRDKDLILSIHKDKLIEYSEKNKEMKSIFASSV